MKIAVVGLGKLGAPLAAVLASKGHDVVGIDLNEGFVRAINEGVAPVVEPQLQEMIDVSRDQLRATSDWQDAISNTEISFVIVPTPSDENGVFTNKYVLSAVEEIGRVLRDTDHYHVVNITSTVMPGSTGGVIREALERASGRKVGENLGLTYNPEFIALGTVVRNMLYPDMLLIGESDKRAGDTLETVYRQTVGDHVPAQRMNWVNAEITKISVNTYVTTKITFANMLSGLCEAIPEADVDVVTEALGADTRIGRKYLRGAIGYGGPCFPRDNVAFAKLAAQHGVRADLATATHDLNQHQVDRLRDLVRELSAPGATVSVLGLAYKPDTPVIEESQGVMLAAELARAGCKVRVHDPLAAENAMRVLGESVEAAATPEDAVKGAEIVLITTPWNGYAQLSADAFRREDGKPVKVVDCWRVLNGATNAPGVSVRYLGVGPAAA